MTVAKGQLALHGVHVWQVPDSKTGQLMDVSEPAVYVVDWPSLAAAASQQSLLTVESDRDFMLTHLTHAQTDSGFIPLRVQISEQNGKNLYTQPAIINAVSSQNAGQPALLAMKKLFRRTNTIKVTLSVDA